MDKKQLEEQITHMEARLAVAKEQLAELKKQESVLTYEKFINNFPIHSRITVDGWDGYGESLFEVVFAVQTECILKFENDRNILVEYLDEDFKNFKLASLDFKDINVGEKYCCGHWGIITVIGKHDFDEEVAIQFDDGSLAIWGAFDVESKLNTI